LNSWTKIVCEGRKKKSVLVICRYTFSSTSQRDGTYLHNFLIGEFSARREPRPNATKQHNQRGLQISACRIHLCDPESRMKITNWQSCHLIVRIRADVKSRFTKILRHPIARLCRCSYRSFSGRTAVQACSIPAHVEPQQVFGF
jgi:hypothetical protein